MGRCDIDHSHKDVLKKLESQQAFLPKDITEKTNDFLTDTHSQEVLNELFHLLKKYDLASEEEKKQRNIKLRQLTA